jgi:TP901-1 family phage major tail protein|tara:strand:- start:118 stop:531 length:414 start_codon:yes stop_codon:yes gene_type:complete
MAAQKGSSLLLKIGDGNNPEGFTTVGGLRSTSISLNDEAVDVTTKDSSNVRELLANGGIQTLSISGSGVFTDAASEGTLRADFGNSTFTNYQVIIPDFGTYTGAFMVASLEYAGEHNGEVTYSVTLESSGTITFASV